MKYPIFMIVIISIISCSFSYENPIDPGSGNYQGFLSVGIDELKAISSLDEAWCVFMATFVVGAEKYHFQISASDDLTDTLLLDNDNVLKNFYFPNEDLFIDAIYYFRVRVFIDDSWSDWSQVVETSFIKPIDTILPLNGQSTSNKKPTLSWNAVNDTSYYEIQISSSVEDIMLSTPEEVEIPSYNFENELNIGEEIFWRIKAIRSDGACSVWSETYKIIIDPLIGDFFEGGIVFYLDGYGRGLVCAEVDQSTGIVWGGKESLVGDTSQVFGTGESNTNLIVEAYGSNEPWAGLSLYAANLCYYLILNDYSDWYLPSREELISMYTNLKVSGIGNFEDMFYWSSSENSADDVICVGFMDGDSMYTIEKDYTYGHVRAIRTF